MSEVLQPETVRSQQVMSAEFLHDLRTPLNQIIGYSEMLSEQAELEGQRQYVPDLQKIHTAGHELLSLLNNGVRMPQGTTKSNGATQMPSVIESIPSVPAASSANFDALILVVDDNKMNRDVLSRRLAGQGYSVVMAENGRAALEIIRTQDFDLVLLDIMMPEIDGFEVLRTLKSDESLHHIPVVMISAVDALESIVKCVELGAEDYLLKPFDPTLLKARVGATLAKKQAHDREKRLHAELQESHERLKELEQVRDDLTHMIIHDLRTPLASVISGMRTLEALGGLDRNQLEIVEIATSGGDTLLGMINDLLDVDKIESGAMQLDYVLLDAQELMSSAVTQVTPLAAEGNLQLEHEVDPDLPPFYGDEEKLRRVLVNLLGNAIKFSGAGGTVTTAIRLGGDKKSLEFSICDTGQGIPTEAFDKIFEKFGQAGSHNNGRTPGTGLGLTFCKLTTEAHGGHIGVASSSGKGTTLSFTIPCAIHSPVAA